MSSHTLERFLNEQLSELKEKGLYNTIEPITGPNGPIITIDQRSLINLSSNNYLGLADHPQLIEAANQANKDYGVGA